jgi:hypothetical protein
MRRFSHALVDPLVPPLYVFAVYVMYFRHHWEEEQNDGDPNYQSNDRRIDGDKAKHCNMNEQYRGGRGCGTVLAHYVIAAYGFNFLYPSPNSVLKIYRAAVYVYDRGSAMGCRRDYL